MAVYSARISADHPALAGHFPGNPLVPGAVILQHVLRAGAAQCPGADILRGAKFISPLRPEETFTIEFAAARAGRVPFTVRAQERTVASGQLQSSEAGHR